MSHISQLCSRDTSYLLHLMFILYSFEFSFVRKLVFYACCLNFSHQYLRLNLCTSNIQVKPQRTFILDLSAFIVTKFSILQQTIYICLNGIAESTKANSDDHWKGKFFINSRLLRLLESFCFFCVIGWRKWFSVFCSNPWHILNDVQLLPWPLTVFIVRMGQNRRCAVFMSSTFQGHALCFKRKKI